MAHIQFIGLQERKSPDGKLWKLSYAFPVMISILIKTDHTFNVVDLHLHKITFQDLIDYVEKCETKIYGISACSFNYLMVKNISKIIKNKHKDSIIIVGGIISGNYKCVLEKTNVDIVSTSPEGEYVLPELLDTIDNKKGLETVKGIAYKDKNGNVNATPKRKLMTREEFNRMPFPAYNYFEKEIKEIANNINSREDIPVKGFPLLTMRGCPFRCTFCGHNFEKYFLRKKWDRFFDELEYLITNFGIKDFYSFDMNMWLNENDVDEYCQYYRERNMTFKIVAELRPTFGSPLMFKKLFEHGVKVICFGMESGSEKILKNMKKDYPKISNIKKIYKMAVDEGIIIFGNFLFGTPGENRNTIDETRDMMLYLEKIMYVQKNEFKKLGKGNFSGYGRTVLIPLPPSEIYQCALNEKRIKNEEKYLISLCNEKYQKILKGSLFKLALAEIGGQINMSEFGSFISLKQYMKYTWNLVKIRTLFLSASSSIFKFPEIFKRSILIIFHLMMYTLLETLSNDPYLGRYLRENKGKGNT